METVTDFIFLGSKITVDGDCSHEIKRCLLLGRKAMINLESESEVAQSCLTVCDPVDCSLPGSSVHGVLQARILEWVAFSFSRGSSRPRDQTHVSCLLRLLHWQADPLPPAPPGKLLVKRKTSALFCCAFVSQNLVSKKQFPHLRTILLFSFSLKPTGGYTVFIPWHFYTSEKSA